MAVLLKFIYVQVYIASYKDIKLNEISRCTVENMNIEIPHWSAVYEPEKVKNIENTYGVDLNIDLKENMLIVSYGAELNSLDYNTLESSYRSRGKYIGFPVFKNIRKSAVYFYSCKAVPIMNTEVARFSPWYNGEYRKAQRPISVRQRCLWVGISDNQLKGGVIYD